MLDPFDSVGKVEPREETRKERVKRHGADPKDMAYRDHRYGPPSEMPKPCSQEFIAAQRRIEAIIHEFRSHHPELDFRQAWIAAGKSIGIAIEAIPVDAA